MAVAELIVKLIGDVSGFSKSMAQVGKDIARTGKSISNAGSALTKTITLPLAGIATASLMMAGEFQASMSKVSALGEITGNDLSKLEKQALELGASTQFSAKQAADGMAELAASGMKTEQIYAAMPGVLDLAAAAQISVGEAAGITATTLGQFQLQAEESTRVADVMARAAAEGQLTILDLAESLKYVGPVAYATGRTLEETSAAIALLSNAGIKGSQAGTALRMGMIRFIKPTKQAQEVIDRLGLSLTDGAGKIKPLEEIIGQLTAKHANLADVTRLVGVEAATAWQALVDKGAPALTAMREKMDQSGGSAAEMAAVLRDNLKGSFEQMQGAVETLGIAIGMALTPAARGLMSIIQGLAEKGVQLVEMFRGLNPNLQNAIIAFLGVVTVAGPIAIVIGKVVLAIGTMIKTLAAAKTALVLFTSATGIGLIVIAVGVAVAAIVYFKDEILAAFDYVAGKAGKFIDYISSTFSQIVSYVSDSLDTAYQYVAEVLDRIWNVFSAAFDAISVLAGVALDAIGALFYMLLDVAGEAIGIDLVGAFDAALQIIHDSWDVIIRFLGDMWNNLWVLARETWQGFVEAVSFGCEVVLTAFSLVVDSILTIWNAAMNMVKEVFALAFDAVVKGLEYAQEVIGIFSDEGSAAIGKLRESIEDLKKPIEINKNQIVDTKKVIGELADVTKRGAEENKKLADTTKTTTEATKKHEVASETLATTHEKVATGAKKRTKEEREAEKVEKEAKRTAEEYAHELDQLVRGSDQYAEALKKIKDSSIPATEKTSLLSDLYKKADGALTEYNEANANYQRILLQYNGAGNVPAEQLTVYITKLEEAQAKLDEFAGSQKKGVGDKIGGLDKLGDALAEQLIGAVTSAFDALLNGGDFKGIIEQLGGSVGGTLGQSLGASLGMSLGGPLGASIGGQLGQGLGTAVGKKIGQVFSSLGGSDSEGTKARKAIDKYFCDLFDANRISVLIEGELKQLKDFDLGSGDFGNLGSAAGLFFQSLSGSAQTAFTGIGTAFAQMSGQGVEYAQGVAIALSQNLGGSLNNLQVMVEGMGLSFEDMEKAVMDSMLASELSFIDAQTALNGIRQIAQKGIPDAVGATVQAFDNLKEAGVKGGRYSMDAMRDLAYEARELGIKTLPDLMKNLLATGKLTSQEVEMVFAALKENGIDSIDAIANATDSQLLAVLARLQAQEFPFAEAVDDARELTDAINDMPRSKDITFNLKTNLDANTKAAMESGFVPNATSTRVNATPNARGNVFSAGAVIPFAKGGVIDDYMQFNIGSMAERGPEAIMPLERLPDGRLGVLSATSNGGGGSSSNVYFTINAPYAQPGAAEAIRREIEKYMDRRNRFPGDRR